MKRSPRYPMEQRCEMKSEQVFVFVIVFYFPTIGGSWHFWTSFHLYHQCVHFNFPCIIQKFVRDDRNIPNAQCSFAYISCWRCSCCFSSFVSYCAALMSSIFNWIPQYIHGSMMLKIPFHLDAISKIHFNPNQFCTFCSVNRWSRMWQDDIMTVW